MIAEHRVWTDVESAVREWTRDIVTSVGRRVFFGTNDAAARPQIVMFRVAGPDDACLIQFDVWGGTKAEAATVAATLASAADALARYVKFNIVLHNAVVNSIRWLPDDADNTPRYIVEVTFMATATTP